MRLSDMPRADRLLAGLGPQARGAVDAKRRRWNAANAHSIGGLALLSCLVLLANNLAAARSPDPPFPPESYVPYRWAYLVMAAAGLALVLAGRHGLRAGERGSPRILTGALLAAYALLFGSLSCVTALDFAFYRDFSAFIVVQLLFGMVFSADPRLYPASSLAHLGLTLALMARTAPELFGVQRGWILPSLYAAMAILLAVSAESRRRKAWVTEVRLEEANEALRDASFLDPLTGLYNRRYLAEVLASAGALARRGGGGLSLVLLDIDHFKAVNDGFGHAAGDAVLVHVARTIETCLRDSDIAARFGGEEFLLLLPHTGVDGASRAAERLLGLLRGTEAPGIGRPVTASAGVATFAGAETDEALIARADEALYEAKRLGRDRVCVAEGGV